MLHLYIPSKQTLNMFESFSSSLRVLPQKTKIQMSSSSSSSSTSASFVCPFVYGSSALFLGKRTEDAATHRWTLFVRGPNEEDLSTFVSQVCFTLHPSFAHPVRIIKDAPFEVSENGWGEFEAGIRIMFHDPSEQPIDLIHFIKLYPSPPEKQPSLKKPVVSESYDEIVFTNPNAEFSRKLMLYRTVRAKPSVNVAKEFFTAFDDKSDLQQLTFVDVQLCQEIEFAKAKLLHLENDMSYFQGTFNSNITKPTG